MRFIVVICRRGDSNPHELPHTPLKRARLPVPPLRHLGERYIFSMSDMRLSCRTGTNKARGEIESCYFNDRSYYPTRDKLKHIGHHRISDTGIVFKQNQNYFLLADGDAAGAVAGAVLAAGAGCCVGDGVGVAVGVLSG